MNNFYDVMDSGYSCDDIRDHSLSLGHVLIIDRTARGPNQKMDKDSEKIAWGNLNWKPAEMVRLNIRTTVERAFSRIKDEFEARHVRVKGYQKVFAAEGVQALLYRRL